MDAQIVEVTLVGCSDIPPNVQFHRKNDDKSYEIWKYPNFRPLLEHEKTLETTSQTAKRAQKLVSPFGELGKSRPQPNPESTAADAQKRASTDVTG